MIIAILAAAAASCGTFTFEGEGSVVENNTISGYNVEVKGNPTGSGNRIIPCQAAPVAPAPPTQSKCDGACPRVPCSDPRVIIEDSTGCYAPPPAPKRLPAKPRH